MDAFFAWGRLLGRRSNPPRPPPCSSIGDFPTPPPSPVLLLHPVALPWTSLCLSRASQDATRGSIGPRGRGVFEPLVSLGPLASSLSRAARVARVKVCRSALQGAISPPPLFFLLRRVLPRLPRWPPPLSCPWPPGPSPHAPPLPSAPHDLEGWASVLPDDLSPDTPIFLFHSHTPFLPPHPHPTQTAAFEPPIQLLAASNPPRVQDADTNHPSKYKRHRERARTASFFPSPPTRSPQNSLDTRGTPQPHTDNSPTPNNPPTHPPTHTHRTSASTQFFLPPPAAPACPPSSPLLSNARSP